MESLISRKKGIKQSLAGETTLIKNFKKQVLDLKLESK